MTNANRNTAIRVTDLDAAFLGAANCDPSTLDTGQLGLSTRRHFLAAGSAVVAASLLFRSDFAASPDGLTKLATGGGSRISVGYVEGSAGAASFDDLGNRTHRVVPASSLRSRELEATDAQIVFHGFSPLGSATATAPFDTVLVDALIPDHSRHGSNVPFYAWTYRSRPAPSASGRTKLRVAAGTGLRFAISIAADNLPASSTASVSTAVFTSGRDRLLPTVQPGLYLLGLAGGEWSTPTTMPHADDTLWASRTSIVMSVSALPV